MTETCHVCGKGPSPFRYVGRGYTGGYSTLARYLRPWRPVDATAGLPPPPAPPAVRQVAGRIAGLPGRLDPADAVRLNEIRTRCPEVDAAVRHGAGFARMIKDLSGDRDTLAVWMDAVDADLPALRSFTAGLCRDLHAVVAGLGQMFADGFELADAFTAHPADPVFVGFEVDADAGTQAVQLLLSLHPAATVLAFGSRGAGNILATAVTIGARGLMLFDVAETGRATPTAGPPLFSRGTSGTSDTGDSGAPLTSREQQILTGMSRGRSNAEIGRALFLSEDTIKTHARRVFNKLGAHDRAHAVALHHHVQL